MPDELVRTPDWARLKRSGFFRITDKPGEIIVHKPTPGHWLMAGYIALFWFMPVAQVLCGHPGVAALTSLMCSLPLTVALLPLTLRVFRMATTAVFTPTDIYLIGVFGLSRTRFEREALQQIQVAEHDGVHFHRFIADNGFASAFFGSQPIEAAIMNNILVAAFEQPVHLDGMVTQGQEHPIAPRSPHLKLSPS